MRNRVLEDPPSSSPVGQTQKAAILTDFCFCLAGSRDCQDGEGERGRHQAGVEGREGARTGEGARERVDEEKRQTCVLVTDRAREGMDPVPQGSQRWP